MVIADHQARAEPVVGGARAERSVVAQPEQPDEPIAHIGGSGSTIIADAHGLLIAERSVGAVIRADFEGRAVAQLSMTPGLGELVHDGAGMVLVADRMANRVVRISPGDASGQGLAEQASVSVREPYGLALSPDSKLLLVTSVADHELLAFATDDLQLRWRVPLAPEPRPVAISPDGRLAAVGFLSSGALAFVDLTTPEPKLGWRALDPRDHVDIEIEEFDGGDKYGHWREVNVDFVESRSRFRVPVETGRRYVRNVRALRFVADELLVAHQLATPQLERMPDRSLRDTYGGGDRKVEPVAHQLTRVARPGRLDSWVESGNVSAHQPAALVHDPRSGQTLVAGPGSNVVAVSTTGNLHRFDPPPDSEPDSEPICGIDGLVVVEDTLWVHCGLSRRLARASVSRRDSKLELLPELAGNPTTEQIAFGAALFVSQDWRFSGSDLACASCHPEGRNDGLSWRLGPEILQTPILAGRVGGTEPYKWDGQDPTLHASFRHTIKRLGGRVHEIEPAELDALAAYLKSLPAPLARSVADPEAAARGREVFEDQGCDACHEGSKLTDGSQHELATRLRRVDTPSLIGVGHSRPYYHDGSAQDLWALIADKGSIHDMADMSGLSDEQARDLIAYLEGL